MKKNIYILFFCILICTFCTNSNFLYAQKKKDKGSNVKNNTKDLKNEELQSSIGNKFIDAVTKLAQELPDEALKEFETVLQLDQQHSPSLYLVANIYYTKKNFIKAEEYAQKAVNIDTKNEFYIDLLKKILIEQDKISDAIKLLSNSVKLFPKNLDFYLELSDLYLKTKKYNDALSLYDEIERKFGPSEILYRQRKDVLLFLNKNEEAVAELNKLINLNPNQSIYVLELSDLYVKNDKKNLALEILEKFYLKKLNDSAVAFKLANFYENNNQNEQSKKIIDELFKDPSIQLDLKLDYLAKRLMKNNGDFKPLEKYINVLELQNPKSAVIHNLKGDYYSFQNKQDSARYYYKQSVTLNENNLQVWILLLQKDNLLQNYDFLYEDSKLALDVFPNESLVKFYYGMSNYYKKNYKESIYILNRILDFDKVSQEMKNQILLLIADSYFYTKDFQKSDSYFNVAINIDNNNVTAMNNYAYFLSLRNEKLDSALYYIEKVIKNFPDNSTYQDTYGWVLYKLKNYNEALIWIEKSYKLNPTAEVANHLGDVYFQLGNVSNAIIYWKIAKDKGLNDDELDKKIKTGKL